jgi:hypothetical protein
MRLRMQLDAMGPQHGGVDRRSYPLATSSAIASAAGTIRWISRTHTPAYSGVTSTLSSGIHGRALTGLYSGSQDLWCRAMA